MKKKRKVEMGQQSSVLSKTLHECLSYLLKQQVRFIIYSYPLESEIHVFVDQPSQALKSYVLNTFNTLNSEELNGQVFTLDNWELIKEFQLDPSILPATKSKGTSMILPKASKTTMFSIFPSKLILNDPLVGFG